MISKAKHRLSSNRIGDDGATFIADLVLALPKLETITFVPFFPLSGFPQTATENFNLLSRMQRCKLSHHATASIVAMVQAHPILSRALVGDEMSRYRPVLFKVD